VTPSQKVNCFVLAPSTVAVITLCATGLLSWWTVAVFFWGQVCGMLMADTKEEP